MLLESVNPKNNANFATLAGEKSGHSGFVGGIVGNLNGGRSYNTYYTPKVYTSSNTGSISTSSEKSLCGGIAGKSYCGEIHGSLNRGNRRII